MCVWFSFFFLFHSIETRILLSVSEIVIYENHNKITSKINSYIKVYKLLDVRITTMGYV